MLVGSGALVVVARHQVGGALQVVREFGELVSAILVGKCTDLQAVLDRLESVLRRAALF